MNYYGRFGGGISFKEVSPGSKPLT